MIQAEISEIKGDYRSKMKYFNVAVFFFFEGSDGAHVDEAGNFKLPRGERFYLQSVNTSSYCTLSLNRCNITNYKSIWRLNQSGIFGAEEQIKKADWSIDAPNCSLNASSILVGITTGNSSFVDFRNPSGLGLVVNQELSLSFNMNWLWNSLVGMDTVQMNSQCIFTFAAESIN